MRPNDPRSYAGGAWALAASSKPDRSLGERPDKWGLDLFNLVNGGKHLLFCPIVA